MDRLVLFCHGYKGFKDWGAWEQVADFFVQRGCIFVKFNFSHNGTTPENPLEFGDLEAFAQNNLSTEMDDLGFVLSQLEHMQLDGFDLSAAEWTVVGHSRGGAIATLRAAEDPRIQRLATWASVSDYEDRFLLGNAMVKWKEDGVYYVKNGRTGQDMPHNYQYYQDFVANRDRLDIKQACKALACPHLIIHGALDEAVHMTEAMRLNKWSRGSRLEIIPEAGHTFGGRHPWQGERLPAQLAHVCQLTTDFVYKKRPT